MNEDYLPESPDEKATRLGVRVVRPKPNELFLDIDSSGALDQCEELLKIFRGFDPDPVEKVVVNPSFKRGHYHVTVTLAAPVNMTERLMLQAMLGSDPKRELLGLRQMYQGLYDDASVFFEAKT